MCSKSVCTSSRITLEPSCTPLTNASSALSYEHKQMNEIFASIPMNEFAGSLLNNKLTNQPFDQYDVEMEVLQIISTQPDSMSRIYQVPNILSKKNRYFNVIPNTETRVKLSVINNEPLTDYINASHIQVNKTKTLLHSTIV
jgi:protein tyrosine phosphatase